MVFEEVLKSWRQCKDRFTRRRLDAPASIEHQYQGAQWGHPSTAAGVRFECAPGQELAFEMRGQWPAGLSADYCRLLHDALSAAIVDVLVAAEHPHIGCSIICTEVSWDDITSSELAITTLRDQHGWSFFPAEK